MNNPVSFQGSSIVACGTLHPELTFLRECGFINCDKIFALPPVSMKHPGFYSNILEKAKAISDKVIVVYGERCYLDFKNPFFTIDFRLAETGNNPGIFRLDENPDRTVSCYYGKVQIPPSGSAGLGISQRDEIAA